VMHVRSSDGITATPHRANDGLSVLERRKGTAMRGCPRALKIASDEILARRSDAPCVNSLHAMRARKIARPM
jgi:hypothetical protein